MRRHRFDHAPPKQHSYGLDMAYDTIHNIAAKTQNHFIRQPSGALIAQKKTSYDFNYLYQGAQPHAPTHIGERTFAYDLNGNQAGWTRDRNGTRRTSPGTRRTASRRWPTTATP